MPSYSSELTIGAEKAKGFANDVFNFLMLGLLILVIVIEILMPGFVYLIAPGFCEDPNKIELTTLLTRITFPFLLFISLASFFSAILNSHNKFAIAAAAPIILKLNFNFNYFFSKKIKRSTSNLLILSGIRCRIITTHLCLFLC